MNLSNAEDRKKAIAVSAFVIVAALVLYFELRDPAPTAPVAPVVVTAPAPAATAAPVVTGNTKAAKTPADTTAALDPTLHMGSMLVTESVVYSGGGRNIFSSISAPPVVAIPKLVAPVRVAAYVAPPPPQPTGPPPPPPIDLKFFGTATTASGNRQALLLHGEDVVVASAGDIVFRRYRIVNVGARSVEVEDMPNSNKQNLPLLANN